MGAATPRPRSIDGPPVVSGVHSFFRSVGTHQFARPHVQHQNFGYKRAAINSQITSTPNQITPVILSPRRQASSWWLSCLQVIARGLYLDHPQTRAIEQTIYSVRIVRDG